MQRTPVIRKHVTAARREEIVAGYRRTQLTQREFARQSGIGLSTLQRWAQKAANPPAFVPVANLLAQNTAPVFCRLVLPGGLIVEVPGGFDSAQLRELLEVVRAL
jgi:transcriptional regulator with XRE-family HTH domain